MTVGSIVHLRRGAAPARLLFGEEETFLLGSREISGESDLDVYSEQSPLGAAINGRKAGETTSYVAPNGKSIEVEIVSAKPYEG